MAKPSKAYQFRDAIQRHAHDAISIFVADRFAHEGAKVIRDSRWDIANAIAAHLSETYRIQQFADIFEWKKTRIKQ